jgi:hypothetical protein
MSRKSRPVRDPYAFSLGGLTTIASFVAPPIVADDRLNQEPGPRPEPEVENRRRWRPIRVSWRRRTA